MSPNTADGNALTRQGAVPSREVPQSEQALPTLAIHSPSVRETARNGIPWLARIDTETVSDLRRYRNGMNRLETPCKQVRRFEFPWGHHILAGQRGYGL